MSTGAQGRRVRYGPSTADWGGDFNVGPICSIPALLTEYGIDPSRVLTEVGVDPDLFEAAENRLSYHTGGRLLNVCVERTGCPHFGLLVGQRFTFDSLGMLGRVMGNSPTLRDALRMVTEHLELQDRGALTLAMDTGDASSALGYTTFGDELAGVEQILDVAIAVHFKILQALCGPSFCPTFVRFAHRRPVEIAPFAKFFNAPLEFDAEMSAIVFHSDWLTHPVPGADPAAYDELLEAIRSIEADHPTPLAERVRRAVYALTLTDSATTANVARLFTLHERTLQRRLEKEGTTISRIAQEVRCDLAARLLRDSNRSVTQISAILGYSDSTVFARAFRAWTDMSPHQWRTQNGSGGRGGDARRSLAH